MKPADEELRVAGAKGGSALIMTIVLTVLLAIVGVLFVMMARVDKIATSSRSESEELKLAVDSIVGTISQTLAADAPHNDPNLSYYDYPGRWFVTTGMPNSLDSNDSWLANLEPYQFAANDYRWRHITDVYKNFRSTNNEAYDVKAVPRDDYPKDINAADFTLLSNLADADGDGVADSRWVKVPNLTTSKGKPVYAAIRIVDNGGMLNINTGYKFDPNNPGDNGRCVDGSSQMQINAVGGLAGRDKTNSNLDGRLFYERFNATGITASPAAPSNTSTDYGNYNRVVWLVPQAGNYTPFDISDELKLRNRFILNDNLFTARIEKLWTNAYDAFGASLKKPLDSGSTAADLTNWFNHSADPTADPAGYDFHHITTTYNMDRVIAPDGNNMFWINDPNMNASTLYKRMLQSASLDPNFAPVLLKDEYAQIAANIKDYRDTDSNVTAVVDLFGKTHYGFERPIIYITELARRFAVARDSSGNIINDANGNPKYHRSYAIEVHRRFGFEKLNYDWRLLIPHGLAGGTTIQLTDAVFNTGDTRFYVKYYKDPCVPLDVQFSDSPEDGQTNVDPNVVLRWPYYPDQDPNFTYTFDVYFGTDPNAVKTATRTSPQGVLVSQDQGWNGYDPYGPGPPPAGMMTPGTTYYWRIDDVTTNNNTGATEVLKPQGDTWSFTVGNPKPDVNTINMDTPAIFQSNDRIQLERHVVDVKAGVDDWVVVDEVNVPPWLANVNDANYSGIASYQRDMGSQRWIQRFWDDAGVERSNPTLGHSNSWGYNGPLPALQAWINNGQFRNVGDIGYMFRKGVYYNPLSPTFVADKANTVGYTTLMRQEPYVRINLADPCTQPLFRYLTVFEPNQPYYGNKPTETRVKGRININTAPWYVIAQLPWVSKKLNEPGAPPYEPTALAKAIVAYRDKTVVQGFPGINYFSGRSLGTGLGVTYGLREEPGFASIGELTTVINQATLTDPNKIRPDDDYSMWYYAIGRRYGDQKSYPDLTTYWRTQRDGVADDYEERNLVFARISDLVTVRSDVFTAYILVRLGDNGPQRRVIAILDRSGARTGKDPVTIVALQPVADAR